MMILMMLALQALPPKIEYSPMPVIPGYNFACRVVGADGIVHPFAGYIGPAKIQPVDSKSWTYSERAVVLHQGYGDFVAGLKGSARTDQSKMPSLSAWLSFKSGNFAGKIQIWQSSASDRAAVSVAKMAGSAMQIIAGGICTVSVDDLKSEQQKLENSK